MYPGRVCIELIPVYLFVDNVVSLVCVWLQGGGMKALRLEASLKSWLTERTEVWSLARMSSPPLCGDPSPLYSHLLSESGLNLFISPPSFGSSFTFSLTSFVHQGRTGVGTGQEWQVGGHVGLKDVKNDGDCTVWNNVLCGIVCVCICFQMTGSRETPQGNYSLDRLGETRRVVHAYLQWEIAPQHPSQGYPSTWVKDNCCKQTQCNYNITLVPIGGNLRRNHETTS